MGQRRPPRRPPAAGMAAIGLFGLAAATAGCPAGDPVPLSGVTCPNQIPSADQGCPEVGLGCSYANPTGCTLFFVASCGADGLWDFDDGCGGGGGGTGGTGGEGGSGGQPCADAVPGPPTVTSPLSVTYAPDASSYRLELSEAVNNVASSLTWSGTGTLGAPFKLDAHTYLAPFTGMTPGTTSILTVGTGMTDGCGIPLASEVAIDITLLPKCHLFGEQFEGDFLSAGWSVVDDAGAGQLWARSDQLAPPTGVPNHTGGEGLCASAGDHEAALGQAWDTLLEAPAIDLSSSTKVVLAYRSDFEDGAGDGDAWLEASADGWSWELLSSWSDDRGPQLEMADLSAYAGGEIYLRWRYTDPDGTGYWWDVDDVCVEHFTIPSCPCPALAYAEKTDTLGVSDGNGSPWTAEETLKSVASEGNRVMVCGSLEDEYASGPDFFSFAVAGGSEVAQYYVTASYCLESKFDQATVQLWSRSEGVPVGGVSAASAEGSFTATLRGESSYYISVTADSSPYPATKYLVSVRVDGVLGPLFTEDFETWPLLNLTVGAEDPCLDWTQAGEDPNGHPPDVVPAKGLYMGNFNAYDCNIGSETLEAAPQNLLTSTQAYLAFDMYHDTGFPTSLDSIQIQYDIGNGWLDIGPEFVRPAAVAGWKTEVVDLSALAGNSSVRIRLWTTTAYGNDILIDNVALLANQ
jgi:hypothetical protein